MTVLQEGSITITVPEGISAYKFDDDDHGLSHCMKAVDFIIEEPHTRIFIEIKDPQAPQAHHRDRKAFIQSFMRGGLDQQLQYKCRDTFLYGYCCQWPAKKVHYYVLIALDSLNEADLTVRTNDLRRKLPVSGPHGSPWTPFVEQCLVFNLTTWNRYLPRYPARRIRA